MNSGVKFPLYKEIILPPIDNMLMETKDFPTYASALQSARNGNIDAAFHLSQHPATIIHYHTECFWLLKAAKGGQAQAQFQIGKAYYYKNRKDSWTFKDRNKKDVDKAKFWLKKSADAGCLDAEFFLASINRDKATIEEYANQGDTYSLFNMGVLWSGYDMSEAFNWFNQAFKTHTSPKYNRDDDRAEGKDINIYAQYNLGVMYDNGLGVPTDKKKAFNYYLASADLNFYNNSVYNSVSVFRTGQGFYMSDNNLGVMYAEGELNTGINMDKARKRIKHALETDMSDSGIPLANWQKYKFDN